MFRLPLHHWHVAHGAAMTACDGWQVPATYPGVQRNAAGLELADLSAFAKASLRGPGVPDLTRAWLGATAAAKPLGVATLPGNVHVCRLTEDHVLLLANSPRLDLRLGDFELRLSALEFECQIVNKSAVVANVTSAYAGFALIGTPIEEMLRQLTGLDVSAAAFPINTCAQTSFSGMSALLIRNQETEKPSMRIYVPSDLGEYVWERLMETGRHWTVAPLGLEEWRSLPSA